MEKFFDYSLKIFVVLSTLFYVAPPPGSDSFQAIEAGYINQELFFRYGVVFLFALTCALKKRRDFFSKSVFSFLLISLVGAIPVSQFDNQVRRQILNVFFGVFFMKIVVEYYDISNLKAAARWLYWLLIANLVMCYMQYFGVDPVFKHMHSSFVHHDEILVGFMKLKANLGQLAAVIAPLITLVSPWLLLAVLPLLYYAKSSSSALAVIVSVVMLIWFNLQARLKSWLSNNRLVVFILMAVPAWLAYLFIFKYDMPTGDFGKRPTIWFMTLKMAMTQSPFLGFGLSSFGKWSPALAQTSKDMLNFIWAHNDFLQAFYEMGVVGLIALICFVKSRFLDFSRFKGDREAQVLFTSFVSILVISFFNFPFHIAKLAGICLFLIALFMAKIKQLELEGA